MSEPHTIDDRNSTAYRLRQALVGKEFKVLDHGYVKLIDFLGDDATIVEAARMSTDGGFVSWDPYDKHPDGDMGLLDFMKRKHHDSPFEMCEAVFEVQAPIMVYREWHRSRTQSYSEFSARYSVMPNLHYVPSPERLKALASSNKQAGSLNEHLGAEADFDTMIDAIASEQNGIYGNYEQLLKDGVPKEIARVNTPVSRYSRMRAKTDLRNWLGFLNLRKRPNAQFEIREFADVVGNILSQLFPRTWGLFEEYDLYSVSFSRTEMEVLRMALASSVDVMAAIRNAGLSGRKKDELIEKLQKGGREILS